MPERDTVVSLVIRKAVATFVTTMIASLVMSAEYVLGRLGFAGTYNLGDDLMGWVFIYLMYMGVIILLYGNAVSFGLEWIRRKGFVRHNGVIFLLHGVFGMALFFVEPYWGVALLGGSIALAYGALDWWLKVRVSHRKGIIMIVLAPIILYIVSWGALQYLSTPMPPFTIEHAVKKVADQAGINNEYFPRTIGQEQEIIDGYDVETMTSAEEISNDIYKVAIIETWEKGDQKGSRSVFYRVSHDSMTRYKSEGEAPPYSRGVE